MKDFSVTATVFRYDPELKKAPRQHEYAVQAEPGMTVLSLLELIREENDPTLAFQHACRSGRCGCCAMRINGVPRLACQTQISELGKKITIEPLKHMPIRKDLIVDTTDFWQKYEQVRPWLKSDSTMMPRETLQQPKKLEKMAPYDECVLCAICYSECPTVFRTGTFLGPASLTHNFRLLLDSRDEEIEDRLDMVNCHAGVWGCNAIFRCARVCPRGILPALAILATRRKLVRKTAAALFGLKKPSSAE